MEVGFVYFYWHGFNSQVSNPVLNLLCCLCLSVRLVMPFSKSLTTTCWFSITLGYLSPSLRPETYFYVSTWTQTQAVISSSLVCQTQMANGSFYPKVLMLNKILLLLYQLTIRSIGVRVQATAARNTNQQWDPLPREQIRLLSSWPLTIARVPVARK